MQEQCTLSREHAHLDTHVDAVAENHHPRRTQSRVRAWTNFRA